MKVFISWSGEASRELALALADWFPKVIQGMQPFVSAKDIDKGAQWTHVLASELNDSDFGVLCLTPANLLSPWLNYEAGAIMSSVDSRVCPVLLGVEKSTVKPPLSQLQLTSIDREDFHLLMRSMNKAAGSHLGVNALDEAVAVWWPQLQEKVNAIQMPSAPAPGELQQPSEPPKPQSTTDEMMEEILLRLRRMERANRYSRRPGTQGSTNSNLPDSSVVVHRLRAMGVDLRRANKHGQSMELFADELPSPLPPDVYAYMAHLSALGIEIRLEAGDRVITFRDGSGDEPPF